MNILFGILFTIFESGFRRLFGSSCSIPVVGSRACQHIVNCCVIGCFLYFIKEFHWISCLLITADIQFWLITRKHGVFFDIGAGGQPDEKTLKRYNSMLATRILNKIFPNDKYSAIYDYVGMVLRYTAPLIPLMFFFNPLIFTMGILIGTGYLFCWWLKNLGYIEKPTDKAEYVMGFLIGIYIWLM